MGNGRGWGWGHLGLSRGGERRKLGEEVAVQHPGHRQGLRAVRPVRAAEDRGAGRALEARSVGHCVLDPDEVLHRGRVGLAVSARVVLGY